MGEEKRLRMIVVASFWVHRPVDFPGAPDYLLLLRLLEQSCRAHGLAHIVLTDGATAPKLQRAGITYFRTELPRNLMRATTEAQARWLEHPHRGEIDTLFVGADCLIRRDPRWHIPPGDLSIILRPGHKRHRINNGFMFIPSASRAKVAVLFRRIADSCGSVMCDDMVAVERALAPMPTDYGPQKRAGLDVNFLPMNIWNAGPKSADDPADDSFVLHFRGTDRKLVMPQWAARWMPAA